MRGIILTLMASLALSSVSFGVGTAQPTKPTLSCTWDDTLFDGSNDAYRVMTVKATGIDIASLGWFTVKKSGTDTNGSVYQVFTGEGVQSPWAGDSLRCPPYEMDSYVIFGNERLACSPVAYPAGAILTQETISSGTSGIGSLTNYIPVDGYPQFPGFDSYQSVNHPMTGLEETVPLVRLVVPQGQTLTFSCRLNVAFGEGVDAAHAYNDSEDYLFTTDTATWGTVDGAPLSIYAPWDGDTDIDGDVDFDDFGRFGDGWFGFVTPPSWACGDIDGDNDVDFDDFGRFGDSWFDPNCPHGTTEGIGTVPEPGTFVMLALGALCLVGYRARRK